MPLFNYTCKDCGVSSEVLVATSQQIPQCPKCGASNMEKSPASLIARQGSKRRRVDMAPCGAQGGCSGGACPHSH